MSQKYIYEEQMYTLVIGNEGKRKETSDNEQKVIVYLFIPLTLAYIHISFLYISPDHKPK